MLRIETADALIEVEECPGDPITQPGGCPTGSVACYHADPHDPQELYVANQILRRFDALPGSSLLLGFSEEEEPLFGGSAPRGRLYQNTVVFVDGCGEWLPVWAVMNDDSVEQDTVSVFVDREQALKAYRRQGRAA